MALIRIEHTSTRTHPYFGAHAQSNARTHAWVHTLSLWGVTLILFHTLILVLGHTLILRHMLIPRPAFISGHILIPGPKLIWGHLLIAPVV